MNASSRTNDTYNPLHPCDFPLHRGSSTNTLTRTCPWPAIMTPKIWSPILPYWKIHISRVIYHSHHCAVPNLGRSQSAFCSFDPIFNEESASLLVCFGRLFSHSPINVEAVFESLLGDSFFNAGQGMSSRFSAALIGLSERGAASKELRYCFSC